MGDCHTNIHTKKHTHGHTPDKAACWYPDESREDEDGADDVPLHDLHQIIRVQLLNDAVKPLDHILLDFLTNTAMVAITAYVVM